MTGGVHGQSRPACAAAAGSADRPPAATSPVRDPLAAERTCFSQVRRAPPVVDPPRACPRAARCWRGMALALMLAVVTVLLVLATVAVVRRRARAAALARLGPGRTVIYTNIATSRLHR